MVQLLSKLSESLKILKKYAKKEKEFGMQVWMCQIIAQFSLSTLLTFVVMVACGFSTKDLRDDDAIVEAGSTA